MQGDCLGGAGPLQEQLPSSPASTQHTWYTEGPSIFFLNYVSAKVPYAERRKQAPEMAGLGFSPAWQVEAGMELSHLIKCELSCNPSVLEQFLAVIGEICLQLCILLVPDPGLLVPLPRPAWRKGREDSPC